MHELAIKKGLCCNAQPLILKHSKRRALTRLYLAPIAVLIVLWVVIHHTHGALNRSVHRALHGTWRCVVRLAVDIAWRKVVKTSVVNRWRSDIARLWTYIRGLRISHRLNWLIHGCLHLRRHISRSVNVQRNLRTYAKRTLSRHLHCVALACVFIQHILRNSAVFHDVFGVARLRRIAVRLDLVSPPTAAQEPIAAGDFASRISGLCPQPIWLPKSATKHSTNHRATAVWLHILRCGRGANLLRHSHLLHHRRGPISPLRKD